MTADVSQCSSAEHRIHQGVQGNIRITVAEQAVFPRNFHTAQNEFPVFRDAVHIVSRTDPESRKLRIQHFFSRHIILHGCELDIPDRAGDRMN